VLLLLPSLAAASSLSGVGVPGAGGALSGVAEPGAAGLLSNPAAAHPDRVDILVDIGALATRYTFTLDGQPQVVSTGVTPVPSLAVAVPLGPVGLGAWVYAPVGRGGKGYDPDGVQRYYTISGSLQVIEVGAALSGHLYLPAGGGYAIEAGAGPRFELGSQSSTRSYDTGALLNALLPDEDIPLQDPLLEGTQAIPGSAGVGVGWGAGLRVVHGEDKRRPDWTVAAGFHSSVVDTLHGTFSLVLSNDLAMEMQGDVETELVLPPDFNAGARVAVDLAHRWYVSGDVSWTGWSTFAHIESRLSGNSIVSNEALVEKLLQSYGITDAEFLDSLTSVTTTTGMHDIVGAGVGVDARLGRRWLPRVRVAYTGAAIPDPNVHPGNVDFANVDVTVAAAYRVTKAFTVDASGDLYACASRDITESTLSLSNAPDSGLVYPPGQGRYTLSAGRFGLSLRVTP